MSKCYLKPKLFSVLKTYNRGQFVKDLVAGIVVAIIALIFAVSALVRSLHNEDPLPEVSVPDFLPGQQQEQQGRQRVTHAAQDAGQDVVEGKARRTQEENV